jgi:hypothetical protein
VLSSPQVKGQTVASGPDMEEDRLRTQMGIYSNHMTNDIVAR